MCSKEWKRCFYNEWRRKRQLLILKREHNTDNNLFTSEALKLEFFSSCLPLIPWAQWFLLNWRVLKQYKSSLFCQKIQYPFPPSSFLKKVMSIQWLTDDKSQQKPYRLAIILAYNYPKFEMGYLYDHCLVYVNECFISCISLIGSVLPSQFFSLCDIVLKIFAFRFTYFSFSLNPSFS